jgi:hypothetical protein
MNSSNYVLATSNTLINKANFNDMNSSNYILATSNTLINKANFNDMNSSNYILATSNTLINKANFNDLNASNYILATSNTLINKANFNDLNASNYILATSNTLINKVDFNDRSVSNYVLSTSNLLAQRINKYSVWEPTGTNIYYYSSGNVGIGTTNPSTDLHIYDDVISETKLTIQNNYTVAASNISASPSATTTGAIGNYTYQVFTYTTETGGTGTRQSLYTITAPAGGITCDILIVGGGGGGGRGGGGGGGGNVLFASNISLTSGSIRVGNGGIGWNGKCVGRNCWCIVDRLGKCNRITSFW